MTKRERVEYLRQKQDVIERAYGARNDTLEEWMRMCIEEQESSHESATGLMVSYRAWCAKKGLRPRSQTDLGLWLGSRYLKVRRAGGMVYIGLRVKLAAPEI